MPCVSILKKIKSEFSESAGDVVSRLKEEHDMYQKRKEEQRAKKKPIPAGEGVLIFDEVKVKAKLHWYSRNNSLVGYAMSEQEIVRHLQ